MQRHELRAIGLAIYGENWSRPLAAALGVSMRIVQRWAAGQTPIPADIAANVRELARIAAYGRNEADRRRQESE